MLRAILFDLDGTLLDLDGDQFLEAYVDHLSEALNPWIPQSAFREALWSASAAAMAMPHPEESNQHVLMQSLSEQLGVSATELRQQIQHFNHTKVGEILPIGSPCPGSREVVEAAQAMGLKVAVATTPIYELPVIMERLRRAQLSDIDWDLIASDEFYWTKPYPNFFHELAARLGVAPNECLMVGDDAFNDLAAGNVGMATFYVGRSMGGLALGQRGSLNDLRLLLPHYENPETSCQQQPE